MADFRRNFSDAARRYVQLSYDPSIHPDERLESLKHAMICAILSPAGQCRVGVARVKVLGVARVKIHSEL